MDLSSSDIYYLLKMNDLLLKDGSIRKISLAKALKYKKPTITKKVKLLVKNGLLEDNEQNSNLSFTQKGKDIIELLRIQKAQLTDIFHDKVKCNDKIINEIVQSIITQADDAILREFISLQYKDT